MYTMTHTIWEGVRSEEVFNYHASVCFDDIPT